MMFRRSALCSVILAITFLSACAGITPAGGVSLHEETVKIPTYLIGPADPNPQFYFGGASQGAQHRIYPYPSYDNLTTEKVDKPYKMVYLENEYLKIGILPESGGKIFTAIDKTNGYHFFYQQSVIKPALISLLGAWISGGVEWDVPHHHRATSFIPVQYTTEESPDGSKTVWVGELELRDRMRWAVGVTLHPGKSYVQAKFRVINRTPLPTSMLCFSNVAVHVNDDYQIIFPPSTQWGTGHGKRDFTRWPVDDNGVDISWYKNHPNSRSVFAWNFADDFMAGYDHGKNVGTMAIADHNVVPGKKFFTWGDGPQGHQQDTLLTDNDGPYIELMVGAYSDNQPDYSWLAPYEARAWNQYWYPFRDLGGVKNANTEAAVNLEVANGRARVAFFSTSDRPGATVSLKLKDQTLLQETVAIDPGKACVREVALPAGTDEHDLRAAISDGGKELIAYSPLRLQPEPRPNPVTPFAAPAQFQTNEELYLAGLRTLQFHAPNAMPDPFWNEALRRDPGDIRVNTAVAIEAIRGGRYADAEGYLRKAIARASDRFTTPKDGEAYYYLGLALQAEGKDTEAFTALYKSTWSASWRNPGYFGLAELAAKHGDFRQAADLAQHSLDGNALDVRAATLRSAVARRLVNVNMYTLGEFPLPRTDPLDVGVMAEHWFVRGELVRNSMPRFLGSKEPVDDTQLADTMNAFPANALDVAIQYMRAGLWQDGTDVLELAVRHASDPAKVNPLVYYDLAYFARRLNKPEEAQRYEKLAAAARIDYAFPFQMEMIPVLEAAMADNPKDARAPYLLGNLLYDWQPERAVALWEKSAELGADFPVVYRNLALAYTRQGRADMRDKALAWLEKAASLGGNAMVFNELDRLYEENGVDPAKRLALLEAHQALVNRDDVIARQINLELVAGKTDTAIGLIKSRFFRAWEGGGRFALGDSWVNANLSRGREQLAAHKTTEALASFQAAQQLPSNLQDATGNTAGRRGEILYWLGMAYEAAGERDKARQAWTDATGSGAAPEGNVPGRGGRGGRGGAGALPPGQFSGRGGAMGGMASGTRVGGAAAYYQGLAWQKLGDTQRANELFQQVLTAGTQAVAANPLPENATTVAVATRSAIADAHYLAALGNLGLGDTAKARQELAIALKISPDHFGAHTSLAALGGASADISAMSK